VIRVETDRKHVTLPRVGTIKTHESTRTLARRVEQGSARIRTATVRREAGRWLCSFTREVRRAERPRTRPGVVVGVDPGITHLAVLSSPIPGVSDGDGFVSNPLPHDDDPNARVGQNPGHRMIAKQPTNTCCWWSRWTFPRQLGGAG
jgi:putative transposase